MRALVPARALGDAEARHDAVTQRLARRRAELAKRAVALGLGERELDAVAALVLPAEATIDRLAARVTDDAAALARHEERVAALEDEALAIEVAEANLKSTYAPKLSKVLPIRKVARYLQIENKIRAIVKYDLAQGVPLVR